MIKASDSLDSAIEAIRAGKLVVVVDDPGREDEGDLVGAAALMTPATINFMVTHARGAFIAVFLPAARCRDLELPPAAPAGSDRALHATRFRVSVDAADAVSGSSAAERARAVNLLGREGTRPTDLVRPGHVVPIEAHEDGLAGRRGHTEAGVALMELAGISPPVAVDLEILGEDGEMARGAGLCDFAGRHALPLLSVAEIQRAFDLYRSAGMRTVTSLD